MRRSWPANLIAAGIVVVTIGVGALGALGSPNARGAGRTSRGTDASTPRCDGRLTSGPVSFDCPSGWFVWHNESPDGETMNSVIISNHRSLADGGGEALPDGWLKVDVYIHQRVPGLTFTDFARTACRTPDGSEKVSCDEVSIGGRRWIRLVTRDQLAEYPSIATLSDGVEVQIVAIVPVGAHSPDGAREIDSFFQTVSIG
jgi:hypothetical protein